MNIRDYITIYSVIFFQVILTGIAYVVSLIPVSTITQKIKHKVFRRFSFYGFYIIIISFIFYPIMVCLYNTFFDDYSLINGTLLYIAFSSLNCAFAVIFTIKDKDRKIRDTMIGAGIIISYAAALFMNLLNICIYTFFHMAFEIMNILSFEVMSNVVGYASFIISLLVYGLLIAVIIPTERKWRAVLSFAIASEVIMSIIKCISPSFSAIAMIFAGAVTAALSGAALFPIEHREECECQ